MLRNTGNSERKQHGQFDVCFIQPTNNRTNNGFSKSGHYIHPSFSKVCVQIKLTVQNEHYHVLAISKQHIVHSQCHI